MLDTISLVECVHPTQLPPGVISRVQLPYQTKIGGVLFRSIWYRHQGMPYHTSLLSHPLLLTWGVPALQLPCTTLTEHPCYHTRCCLPGVYQHTKYFCTIIITPPCHLTPCTTTNHPKPNRCFITAERYRYHTPS